MSTNRSRRIDRATAEHLLGGTAADPQGGRDPLAELLAAAASPGTASELAGEWAALTAFRVAARLVHVPQPRRRRSMASCTPSRSLTAKVAAAALAATAVGGVAVAARTGNLPVTLDGPSVEAPSAGGTSGTAGAAAPGVPLGSTPGTPGGPGRGTGTAGLQPGVSAGATASLLGLCRDWQGAGQASTDSRFEPLTRAAGGPDRVPAYCRTQSGRPDPGPTASHGAGDGSGPPDKPTTAPTRIPTPAPSSTDGGDGGDGHTHSPAPPGPTASGHAR